MLHWGLGYKMLYDGLAIFRTKECAPYTLLYLIVSIPAFHHQVAENRNIGSRLIIYMVFVAQNSSLSLSACAWKDAVSEDCIS